MYMPKEKQGKSQVIMNITKVLVDLLVKMVLEFYGTYGVCENGCNLFYVKVLKDFYGIMVLYIMLKTIKN